jgi:hypothetical protein
MVTFTDKLRAFEVHVVVSLKMAVFWAVSFMMEGEDIREKSENLNQITRCSSFEDSHGNLKTRRFIFRNKSAIRHCLNCAFFKE